MCFRVLSRVFLFFFVSREIFFCLCLFGVVLVDCLVLICFLSIFLF